MEKNAKIYVAGHRGLVGSAIWKNLQDKGYTNLVGRTHKELDLLDGTAVRNFFDEEQPEYVFLAAAFVGGIMANSIAVCNRQNCRTENVRELQPAIWNELHRCDADKSLRTE